MVTSAKLSSATLPVDRVLDGKNMLPVLTGKSNKSPHKEFYFEYLKHAALRKGDWKIVRTGKSQPWQLYNLSSDLGESKNLAKEQSAKVKELAAAFENKQKEWK